MVDFENNAGSQKDMFPLKIICFFTAVSVVGGPTQMYALVYPCTYQHVQGNLQKRIKDKIQLQIMERW